MNPYLTQKSVQNRAWRIPVTALCVFTAAVTLTTAVDFIRQKSWGTVCVDILMMALLLYPVYRNIRHIVRCREARQIARQLEYRAEERISMEALSRDIAIPHLAKKLDRLIEYGFLQNIHIDVQERAVVLTAPNQRLIDEDIVEMECPGCGAKNRVTLGRVGRCVYCEQPLILRADSRKKDE